MFPFLRRNDFGKALLALVASTVLLQGCTRPDHMMVRSGLDPEHQDTDVAFRTTYYFRVFDYCTQKKRVTEFFDGNGDISSDRRLYTVMNDAMYRFTMTGKANTLFSDIHFESGTLQAHQIDPLGSQMEYDQKKRRFTWSRTDSEDKTPPGDPKLAQLVSEIKALNEAGKNPELVEKLNNLYEARARQIAGVANDGPTTSQLQTLRAEMDSNNLEAKAKATAAYDKAIQRVLSSSQPSSIYCPDDAPVRRGFQILGPEGWRTFDQDERLIMAMSTNAEPLISVLSELSQRVLNARNSTQGSALAVLEEEHKLILAERVLDAGADQSQASKDACKNDNGGVDCNQVQMEVFQMSELLSGANP